MAAPTSKDRETGSLGLLSVGPPEAQETLVFLHGWAGSKELWRNTLTALPDHLRGLALDLPGTGGTPLSPTMQTMGDMAVWVAQTCRYLNLTGITLVGHSLGGNLAAQVALDHPALVRRLVLVDAALEPAHLPVRSWWPLSPRYGLTALRLMRWSTLPLAALGRRVSEDHVGGEWVLLARRASFYVRSNTDPALQVQLRALMSNPLNDERLSVLRLPLLIVHGAHDAMISRAHAESLAAALPQAHLKIFPTAYHCPMDTDPAAFAQALQEFCTE